MKTLVTTFPNLAELERARGQFDALGLEYRLIPAAPGYARVGTAAIVTGEDARMRLAESGHEDFISSGWVAYRGVGGAAPAAVPSESPPEFAEDVFGHAAVMVLAPCVADRTKIRATAHVSGDLGPAFPYMNAAMRGASFNPEGPTFTFMEAYRMIAVYPHRITIAKADDVVDAWRVLERIRAGANDIWGRRAEIEPSYEVRRRPPALEIFKRLPGTNCGECGDRTCLAFAARLWKGEAAPAECRPVFGGEGAEPMRDLQEALRDICAGLGVSSAVQEGSDA
ncbi:MAG: (Fe-S)-binding protein [Planctomycetota bacterium]